MVYTVVIHAPAIDEVVTVAAESAAHAKALAVASALRRQALAATVTVELVTVEQVVELVAEGSAP